MDKQSAEIADAARGISELQLAFDDLRSITEKTVAAEIPKENSITRPGCGNSTGNFHNPAGQWKFHKEFPQGVSITWPGYGSSTRNFHNPAR